MGDPNWLLSSAAQSAAAVVGIVGAFLVNRIVALAGEKSTLSRLLSDADSQLVLKRTRLDYVKELELRREIGEFLNDYLSEVIDSHGQLELDELIARDRYTKRSVEEIRGDFQRMVDTVKSGFGLFGPKAELPDTLDEFLQGAHLNPTSEQEYLVLSAVFDHVRKERQGGGPFGIANLTLPFESPEYRAARMQIESRERSERIRELRRERDELEMEIIALLVEQKRTADRLSSLARPPGLWAAVAVLCYFAAVGVALPIALLPLPFSAFAEKTRWSLGLAIVSGELFRNLVILLFASGLIAVLSYFIWAIRVLTRDSSIRAES